MSNKQLIKKYKNAEVEFKNGVPTSINCGVSMKLTTEPYENININAGVSLSLKDDANIDEAYEEVWGYLFNQVATKAEEIKKIYQTAELD